MRVLTAEEKNNWLRDPVTKKVLRSLEALEEDILAKWAGGTFKGYAECEFNRGIIHGLRAVFEVPTYEIIDSGEID